jgi:hypothetical protein
LSSTAHFSPFSTPGGHQIFSEHANRIRTVERHATLTGGVFFCRGARIEWTGAAPPPPPRQTPSAKRSATSKVPPSSNNGESRHLFTFYPRLCRCVCVCGLKNYKLARFDGRDVCSFFFLFLQTSFVDFRRRGCATGGFRHATGAGFRDEGRKVNRMNKKEIEVIHGTKEVNCCVILLLSFFIMSETFFIHFILNPPYLCRGNFRCKESEKCAGGQIKSVDFFIVTYYFVVGSMEEVVFATKLFKKDRVGWNL